MVLFLAGTASAAPAGEVAALFLDTLVADDVRRIGRVTDGTTNVDTEDFRELIDVYDCITLVRAGWSVVSATDDAVKLRFDVDGTYMAKAEWRPVYPLPRRWSVEGRRIGGAWKLVMAISEERLTARAMAGAATFADAECMLAASAGSLSLPRLLLAYGFEAERTGRRDTVDHAARLAHRFDAPFAEISARRMEARVLRAQKAPPEAVLETAERGLEVANEHGTPDELAEALFAKAAAHVHVGDVPGAREWYRASAELAGRVNEPVRTMKSLYMYAWASTAAREPLDALRATEELAGLTRRFGWEEGQAIGAVRRAEVQIELRRYDGARAEYESLIRSGEQLGNRQWVVFGLFNIASILRVERVETARAIDYVRRALSIWTGDSGVTVRMHTMLALLLSDSGLLDEAHAELQRAEALHPEGDQAGLARASSRLARGHLLVKAGRLEEAIPVIQGAVALYAAAAKGEVNSSHAAAMFQFGSALRAAKRPDEAIATLLGAVAQVEEIRDRMPDDALVRAAYFAEFLDGYAELVELLIEQGRLEEALGISEKMKARGLRDIVQRGRIDLSASMSAEERARETVLERRVAGINRELWDTNRRQLSPEVLGRQLADARAELERFRREMRLAHPAVARRHIEDGGSLELPEGQSLAVVEYVVAPKRTTAFVLTRGRNGARVLRAFPIAVTREALERETGRMVHLIANRSLVYEASARRLYSTLVAPLEGELAGKQTICVIPDGTLWNVPFHALVRGDGKHLLERHAVFYAHSLGMLHGAQAARATGPSRLIAFGNPTVGTATVATVRAAFPEAPLGMLPDAETEARSLSGMYAERSRAYYRDEARETVFKGETPKFDIIHVAAHALIDDAAPMYSAIVLATGREAGEDGLLEAREVIDLPLRAELAVLSACETARGKVGGGEGAVGIAWAFFAAGCPTTVVSQWKAESRATSILMIDFHRRLLTGATTAEALRGAQLALRKSEEYAHPFYWAPFVALGAAMRTPGDSKLKIEN